MQTIQVCTNYRNGLMEQYTSQEETRRIIISDMVKKRNSIVPYPSLTSMKERGYYGLSFLSQYYNEQGHFLDDFMDFVSKNRIRI